MHHLIDAYGSVRDNLLLHASGWPTAAELHAKVFSGQPAYGMAAVGPGGDSAGSNAMIAAIDRADPRPLWICLWGGANTLAQALFHVQATRPPAAVEEFVKKVRVYSISDQDDAGPWIRSHFPSLSYIVQPSSQDGGDYAYATWTGISGDAYYRNGEGADSSLVSNDWLDANIRGKGQLGKLYPRYLFIMEGDTPSFLNLVQNGLESYRSPDWGGWGGRYTLRQPSGETRPIWTQGGDVFMRANSQDTVTGIDRRQHTSDQATIWRWREAYQNDFSARMQWTIADYRHANHAPEVVVNGDRGTAAICLDVNAGQTIALDAAASHDPDGQKLRFHWLNYEEAGGTGASLGDISLTDPDEARTGVVAKATCRDGWFRIPNHPCPSLGVSHIILAVTDGGSPELTSYRRIILRIHGNP
jgi:hypothetical protein